MAKTPYSIPVETRVALLVPADVLSAHIRERDVHGHAANLRVSCQTTSNPPETCLFSRFGYGPCGKIDRRKVGAGLELHPGEVVMQEQARHLDGKPCVENASRNIVPIGGQSI